MAIFLEVFHFGIAFWNEIGETSHGNILPSFSLYSSIMPRNLFLSLILSQLMMVGGCACFRDNVPGLSNMSPQPNPMFVASNDPDYIWDRIVDAVDDYFEIEREEPIQMYGNLATEGRIDTRPQIAATYLEPWFHDSVTQEEQLVSTCQTVRRRATVRVAPENKGFMIFVSVYKELEDLQRPLGANAGAAGFTHVNSINTITNIGSDAPTSYGWIHLGRDAALEQRILLKIRHNIDSPPMTIH